MGGITGSKSWRLLGMKAQLPSQGLVSFSLLQKDVGSVLDFMERLKNEGQKAVDVNEIEKFKMELAFICLSVQLPYSNLEQFEEIMNFERQVISDLLRSILCDVEPNMGIKYDKYHVLARLRNSIDFFISSRHRSKSGATMTKEQLNFLLLNLHCLSEFAGKTFPLRTQYEIIHKRIISSAPSSSSDLMPRKVTVDYYTNVFGIHNFVPFGSKKKRCSSKHLYSLRITGDKLDNSLSDICHLRDLRLLRVLELYSSMVKHSLLNEICMLNHLRALHIVTEIKYLPLSFSNLSNLESLMVENDKEDMVLLPGIWDLVNLRVLSMDSCSFLDMDTEEPILITENIKLKNLRILDRLMLSYSKDTVDIFKRFPNLQQLIFILKESWDYSTEGYWFTRLNFLNELEILKVEFKSSNSNHSGPSVGTNRSWDFLFPLNLKVLDLHAFPLTSESLSTIARLTNLEELALVRTIIVGEEWNMGEEDTFENKKYLGLESTLSKLEFLEESFPMLEKLELQRCHELEEIPPSFGDICSLKIIKLVESPQLEDSALEIKQYVEDMTGEDKLQILGPNNIPLFK
ncbi:putative late blight resistance protein -like protein R1B-14-like [Capsicum annuum]|nr:putative late blight resistance protein -like protein R1B-14-like [Capsicum annuum]